MDKQKSESDALHRLREQAEALAQTNAEDIPAMSPEEVRRVVQDLRTHEIELEMQNEQLRQAQEELIEAHERLSDLYDLAPVGYVTLSEKGLILKANLTIAEMLGVERRFLTNQPMSAHIVDEDQDIYYRHRNSIAKGRGCRTCELRMCKKDGEVFWASLECDYRERLGEAGSRCIIVDVSEKRRAQDSAKATAREWETTFNAISDSIAIIGKGGLIQRCNKATATILDRPLDEIVGHACWELVHGRNKPIENCPYTKMTESRRRESEEVLERGKCLRITVDPILDDDDEITGAVHTMVDITGHKRMAKEKREFDEKIQQTQKLESLGVMAGGIAHDFNNILYVILGNADIALDEMQPEAVGRDSLQEIQIAARRAASLTDQMLAYSGKGALAIEKMDLSGLVQEMAHMLEVSHTKKAIVRYRFKENLPAIEGDPSQLRQVVMNLITNASEALGEEGGIITVATEVTDATQEYLASTYAHDELSGGRYVYLEVIDTGCGMDEETQRRIFEPFFTTKFTGRGLGMAAVLGIVRAHHGAIDIKSEVDHGTTIKVLFPALDEPSKPIGEAVPQEKDWRGSGTILVVDDERQLRLLQQLVLEQKGYTVLTAEDGKQAVEVFRESKDEIACVLLDLTMPHMGGRETYAELRRMREDVQVILVSGYSEEELKEHVENLGFAGFLKKPVRSKVLLDKVREVLTDGRGK